MFGLFKKGSNDAFDDNLNQNEQKSFEKMVINTKDLLSDLEDISKNYNISLKEIDIKMLSYKSYMKDSSSDKVIEITELNKEKYLSEEYILNENISYTQELRVEVYKKEGNDFPLLISLAANKDLTQVRATVKSKEKITYFDGLEGEIISQIEKKKAKLGLMIGMMDENMRSGVKKLISLIRVNKGLSKNISFIICEGFSKVDPINQEIIEVYKNKNGESTNGQKSMCDVKEGDLVIEVLKAKEGRVGRDCKGKILSIDEISLNDAPVELNMSEDFILKEDDDKIQYFANKSGYIYEGIGNKYEIKDELVVDSVSVKTTGDIDIGEESDVRVTIQEDNSALDAVGPGVEIDTNELNIAGSVANNAKIKANIVQIKGQTHQSSKVEAKEIQIHLHKGYAEGDEIEIEILEGGVVIGDIVRVKKFFGGEIRAKEVYLDEVTSNSKVFASHHIEINKITGNGNIFRVDALAQRNFHQIYEELTKKYKEVEIKLSKFPKILKSKKRSIDNEKENIKEINKTLEELKKFGREPLASLVMKLKDHQKKIKEFNSLLKELKDAKLKKETLHQELVELNTSVLKAKVINNSPWKEFNEVVFKLIEPPIEISFLPKEGEITKVLTLKSSGEGEYNIKRGA